MAHVIYRITNTVTSRVYIGLTQQAKVTRYVDTKAHGPVPVRFAEHLGGLLRRDHYNAYMQADYDKHGYKSFVFEVLETLPESITELQARQVERDYMKGQDTELYNIRSHRREPQKNRGFNRAEVMKRVRAGEAGKVIAAELGLSPATVSLVKKSSGECSATRNSYADRVRAALADPVVHQSPKRRGKMNLTHTASKHGIPVAAFKYWNAVIKQEKQ